MTHKRGIRVFFILIFTQILSLIGSEMTSLALGIWLFTTTGDVTPLALIAFFTLLPSAVMASLGGVLADLWNRRYVIILADVGQAVGTIIILFAVMNNSLQPVHLYLVTFMKAVFTVFQRPAIQASITLLIPDEYRGRANAFQQLVGPTASILGPILAGGLYAVVGLAGIFAIDLITFIVAVIVVISIEIPQHEKSADTERMNFSFAQELTAGIRYLLTHRGLFYLNVFLTLVNFLFGAAIVLFTPYLLARTGDSVVTGGLLSAVGLGSVTGGLIMAIWGGGQFTRVHTVILGICPVGILLIGLGMSQSPLLIGIFLFMTFIPLPIVNASSMAIVQAKVAPELQGRVFAAQEQIYLFMLPLAYLITGPLADLVFEPFATTSEWSKFAPLFGNGIGSGMGLMIALLGLGIMIIVLAAASIPKLRNLEALMPNYSTQPP